MWVVIGSSRPPQFGFTHPGFELLHVHLVSLRILRQDVNLPKFGCLNIFNYFQWSENKKTFFKNFCWVGKLRFCPKMSFHSIYCRNIRLYIKHKFYCWLAHRIGGNFYFWLLSIMIQLDETPQTKWPGTNLENIFTPWDKIKKCTQAWSVIW